MSSVSVRFVFALKASCQVGGKRMVARFPPLEGVSDLAIGETRRIEFMPFVEGGLDARPSKCEITPLFGPVLGTTAVSLQRDCFSPDGAGKRLAKGPCRWD